MMRYLLGLLLVLALATALRMQHARSRESVWRDEAQDWFLVKDAPDLKTLVGERLRHEGHPPLHYVLEFAARRSLGDTPSTVRGLSILWGVLTVAALMLLAVRLFGRRAALLTGLLAATSPFLIYYSTEMRVYALFSFVSVLHAAALFGYVRRPRLASALLWGVSSALLLYTHYYGIHLIVAGGLFALLRDRTRPNFVRIALAGGLCSLLFAPWLPVFALGLTHDLQPWYVPKTQVRGIYLTMLLPAGKWGALILLWALARGVQRIREPGADADRALALRTLLWMALGGGALAWVAQFLRGPFLPRYLIGNAALLLPCAAFHWASLFEAKGRRRTIASVLVVLALLAQRTDPQKWNRTISPAASMAAQIQKHERPGDWIWISPAFFAPSLVFHYEGTSPIMAPPYEGRITWVDWIDIIERENDPDLLMSFLDRLEAHLQAGGRVWLVKDGYFPVKRRWAMRDDASDVDDPVLVRQEHQIHRRVLRVLYRNAETMYWRDAPDTEYHEAMSLILFDPARKRDPSRRPR